MPIPYFVWYLPTRSLSLFNFSHRSFKLNSWNSLFYSPNDTDTFFDVCSTDWCGCLLDIGRGGFCCGTWDAMLCRLGGSTLSVRLSFFFSAELRCCCETTVLFAPSVVGGSRLPTLISIWPVRSSSRCLSILPYELTITLARLAGVACSYSILRAMSISLSMLQFE